MLIEADCIVAGGGVAGVMAAISAKRSGAARVVLLEKNSCLGGTLTYAGVGSILTFHSVKGKKIISGLAEEFINNLIDMKASYGHSVDTVGVAGSVTMVIPAAAPIVLLSMCTKDSVDVFTGTELIGIEKKGSSIIKAYCKNENETLIVKAPYFVDATGSGELSVKAGEDTVSKDMSLMPESLLFTMSNVDINKIKKCMKNDRENFHYETTWDKIDSAPILGCSGFFREWKDAGLDIPRDRVLFYQFPYSNDVSVNMVRILPQEGKSYSRRYKEGLLQVKKISSFLRKHIPGFENSTLTNIAPCLGQREVRRIKCEYVLTESDVLNCARFDDEAALGGFPIDLHSAKSSALSSITIPGDGYYGIPFRCFKARNTDNLFVVGKCFSADLNAHASARVQATCMAMGEAVGKHIGNLVTGNF